MSFFNFIAKRALFMSFLCIFIAGWLSNIVYSNLNSIQFEAPFIFTFKAPEIVSPSDHIKENQIHVYKDKIEIDITDAMWAKFTDTNSMDPLFDVEANTIEIRPTKPSDIHIGDIVSYKPRNSDIFVVHRVIKTDYDSNGWYAIVKGDNVEQPDPEKIRFEQVNGILVAIIY